MWLMPTVPRNLCSKYGCNRAKEKGVIGLSLWLPWYIVTIATRYVADAYCPKVLSYQIRTQSNLRRRSYKCSVEYRESSMGLHEVFRLYKCKNLDPTYKCGLKLSCIHEVLRLHMNLYIFVVRSRPYVYLQIHFINLQLDLIYFYSLILYICS